MGQRPTLPDKAIRGHAHKESDPMCRRTPPEAKTAQVVDATLCARNSRETLKHPAPLTPPTPSLGVGGVRGAGKKGHITTII